MGLQLLTRVVGFSLGEFTHESGSRVTGEGAHLRPGPLPQGNGQQCVDLQVCLAMQLECSRSRSVRGQVASLGTHGS